MGVRGNIMSKFHILSLQWYLVLIIIVIFIAAFLVVYFIMNRSRLAKAIKVREKKMDDFESKNESKINDLFSRIPSSHKYDGRFSSLPGKLKKEVIRYLQNWMAFVPSYVTFKMDKKQGRYERIFIDVSKDKTEIVKGSKNSWCYLPEKSQKKNMKNLIKFMNKYKVTYGTLEVINKIFDYEKGGEGVADKPMSFEHQYNIIYTTRSKKTGKVQQKKEKK